MPKLTDEVQTFIVRRLACYDTPQQVADAVREEFGVAIDRRQVAKYDATRAGKRPSEKWCALFHATRRRFLKRASKVPEANLAVRLRRLSRMSQAAESRGNFVLAAQLLEQIAKEVGGLYTNRRVSELTGKDGGPIATRDATLDDMTTPELIAATLELAKESASELPPRMRELLTELPAGSIAGATPDSLC